MQFGLRIQGHLNHCLCYRPQTKLTTEELNSVFLRTASFRQSRNRSKTGEAADKGKNLPWTAQSRAPAHPVEAPSKSEVSLAQRSSTLAHEKAAAEHDSPKDKDKTLATKSYKVNLPPAELEGFLERKQELMSGGTKVTNRKWKRFYSVLCGQLLCFFKDRKGKRLMRASCCLIARVKLSASAK